METQPKQMSEPIPLLINEPTLPVFLFNNKPTHFYRMALHHHPCTYGYKSYMCEKYGLDQHWDDIGWICFGNAVRTYDNQGPTLTKFLHGLLEKGSSTFRHGKFKQPTCSFCECEETTAHLFQFCDEKQRATVSTILTTLWD